MEILFIIMKLRVKSKIGYLPENNPLYEDMYVRESIGFIAQIHKVENWKIAVENVIEKVGLYKEAHKKLDSFKRLSTKSRYCSSNCP